MGRKCEVHFCPNNDSKSSGRSFYKFPKQPEECYRWVQFCCSPELEQCFLLSGPGALSKKKICSDHFAPADFKDDVRREKGLKYDANPSLPETVDIHYGQAVAEQSNFFQLLEDDMEFLEEDSLLDGHDSVVEELQPHKCSEEEFHDNVEMEVEYLEEESISIKDFETNPATEESWAHASFRYEVPVAASAENRYKSDRKKRLELESQIKTLKKRLNISERTSKRRAEIIQKKRIKVRSLNEELKRFRTKIKQDAKIMQQLKDNPVLFERLRNSVKIPKARRYGESTKKFALTAYLCGPRVYRMIKNSKVLCLPSKRSIKRWTEQVSIQPGLNKAILRGIKAKVPCLEEKERVVILAIDGMKIKSSLSYTAKNDLFHGFPDSGLQKRLEKNNPLKLASEAVVVMVRGIYKNFKQGLGYFLTHNTLGSEDQFEIVQETIREIRKTGLRPMVLTMDQFSTNTKMAKEAGVTIEKPYFEVDGEIVYVMWDSPHLTKNTRNMLKKHNAVFGSKIASFEDIKKLYEVDSISSTRLVPRLTEKHIEVPPFSPMNVSLATRTLSQSVATGIRFYALTGDLPDRAVDTAHFIQMHDKLFDTFNSRRTNCPGKPLRGALKADSGHFEFLEFAKEILTEMYYTNKYCFDISEAESESQRLKSNQRYPNYIKGFLNNINALKLIWNDLCRLYDCTYLCTNHISQDCLENLFSEIRRRCGFNDAPDALQFGAAFKYAAISASLNPAPGSNCEVDNAYPLLNDVFENEGNTTIHTYKTSPLDKTKQMEISTKDVNALIYILGASVRKLEHPKCISELSTEYNVTFMNDDMFSFTKLKQHVSGRQHKLPNSKLYSIGIICYYAFQEKFRKFLCQNKKGVKTRLKAYVEYTLFDDSVCEKCFNRLVDKIFNTLIQGFLKQVKSTQTLRKTKLKRFKRNQKAKRMCLPL